MRKNQPLLRIVIILIVVNILSSYYYKRFDLTQDKRYTLSEAALQTIEGLDQPLLVEVLLEGNFPAEFKRLQHETRQLLEEFASQNRNIKYQFINPTEDAEHAEEVQWQLAELGILPAQVTVQDGSAMRQELIYPWAVISFQERMVKVPLLKNQLGSTPEERITNSIQNLEYAFADGFNKIIHPKKRKVAVLKGNGQVPDRFIADFISTLKEYYYIGAFTLDSVANNPIKTLNQLNEYDLLISAGPTETFTDSEKYVLDQYTMKGGKSLWLIDQVDITRDSLMAHGKTFAFGRDLNLTDMFFRYGVRINPILVNDPYSAPMVLAIGSGSDTQYQQYPWFYSPLTVSNNRHPIVHNIEAVKFDFASQIDTLENDVKKTILLSTSPITRLIGTPTAIQLDEIDHYLQIINQGPDPSQFSAGEVPLAVLLEGNFTSAFRNRVKPFKWSEHSDQSAETMMIVISDSDVIKNQMDGNRPMELGYDKWTNMRYGNKEFLLNAVNYLLDDSGLINIRSKVVTLPFLDTPKVIQQRNQWQITNLLLPLVILALIGLIFYYFRKRSYT